MNNFPKNFSWGVATSSYQIEGAAFADGRGESIWDRFCATPGKVANSENGSVACDHYHRFSEDIAIMKEIGVDSYRFSLAWPRLFPKGDRVREQRGFDFYNRLIDELIANDIKPLITLYHWDLPQPLQDKGGWANRGIVNAFTDYAVEAVKAFGDRVDEWITINEPWCVSWLGYMNGVHAPGVKNLNSALAAAHHTALAHAMATRAMREIKPNIRSGLAVNMTNYVLEDDSNPELRQVFELMDSHLNRWWLDAQTTGHYPRPLVDFYGDALAKHVLDGDEDLLKIDSEILGINYYSDNFLGLPNETTPQLKDNGLFPFPQRVNGEAPPPHTDMGWPITPDGLENLLVRVAKDWPEFESISITENGAAFDDGPDQSGEIKDARRVEYLIAHIEAAGRAVSKGVPLTSYFAWSLLDNFEWAEGYQKRFGLVYVDFHTLERTLKNSAKTYASIIEANSRELVN